MKHWLFPDLQFEVQSGRDHAVASNAPLEARGLLSSRKSLTNQASLLFIAP